MAVAARSGISIWNSSSRGYVSVDAQKVLARVGIHGEARIPQHCVHFVADDGDVADRSRVGTCGEKSDKAPLTVDVPCRVEALDSDVVGMRDGGRLSGSWPL